jgi:hypothetical protein
VFQEDSAQFPCQKNSVPCQSSGRPAVQSTSRLDNVSYRPDAHQTKASSVRTTWIPVWTFLCVEKLQTAPACICPDVLAAHPDDSQCSTKASGFLFKTQIWEDRCNRTDDVDFHLDVLIHKASITIQIQTSGR